MKAVCERRGAWGEREDGWMDGFYSPRKGVVGGSLGVEEGALVGCGCLESLRRGSGPRRTALSTAPCKQPPKRLDKVTARTDLPHVLDRLVHVVVGVLPDLLDMAVDLPKDLLDAVRLRVMKPG